MKVLLITYAFPPCGAIGAKRWGEFYQLSLQDDDLEFEVLTVNWKGEKINNDKIHYIGEELEYIPPKSLNYKFTYVDVLKHPTIAIRSLDSSIFLDWYKKSKQWILENKNNSYDFIISSYSPTASIHLGNYAKDIFKVPHILDLRDLISIQGQKLKIPFFNVLDRCIDIFMTRKVDKFLVVSPTCNEKAKNFYKKDILTIYNGLEKPITKDILDLTIINKQIIRILYTGTLGLNRNPKNILDILDKYAKKNDINIYVNFASQDNPFDFISRKEIKNIQINWLGYLSKTDLKKEIDLADSFLLLENFSNIKNENLPGKIFEYIYNKKPILVSCNKNSDIVNLLKEINAGLLVESEEDLKKFINEKRYLDIQKTNFYTRYNQYELLKNNLIK